MASGIIGNLPTAVLARDITGEEHDLYVCAHANLLCLQDDEVTRILTPNAALVVGWALVCTSARAIGPGALSAHF